MTKFIERRNSVHSIKKDIVIIYHGDCSDGFGGAWSAWKKFGSRADYIPVQPSSKPPAGLKDKEIYLIDFVYKIPDLKKIIKANRRVTAIDHHISNKPATEMTKQYSYALHNSGSVLAWKYFHPGKKVPTILKYVEDTDLWNLKLPYTNEIFSFLDIFDFSFKTWSKLAQDLENPRIRRESIKKGQLLLMHEQKLIERMINNNTELVRFAGQKTLAVNSPNFASKIGNTLSKILPPMGIIWSERKGKIIVSLRSNGTIDVSKIAQKFGGGGHKAASGFSFPAGTKLPWKIIKK